MICGLLGGYWFYNVALLWTASAVGYFMMKVSIFGRELVVFLCLLTNAPLTDVREQYPAHYLSGRAEKRVHGVRARFGPVSLNVVARKY